MKKIAALFSALIALLISVPAATAATPVIRIVDIPHRNFDGTFRDNELAQTLTADGRLGKPLFRGDSTATWVIDAHLVDEVIDMADGYTFEGKEDPEGARVAFIWLQQLRIATTGNPIVALPYGNPDPALARKLAPSEIKFYSQLGAEKLEAFFARPVISQNGWSSGKSRLESQYQGFYRNERSLLLGLNKVIADDEITQLRERLGITLNPLLGVEERAYFSYSARQAVSKVTSKLKIVSGRYQLTSETVKVPLTLVNKFDTATTVNLWLTPMNSRVQVQDVTNITIPSRSQIQIAVPFSVIASGSTLVLAQFASVEGDPIGEVSKLNLALTVIDSRVTWFTTGAAILLFAGAITQSFRRIKRSRNEE
jgi:Family of unknown function (DUF6049)